MKKFFEASYIALLAATSTVTFAAEPSDAQTQSIDMFPEALKGYTRHVIRLPKLEDEARIDLLPGKVVRGDTCNKRLASVSVEKENIQGWGFSYYKISDFNAGPSTLMACPSGEQDIKVIASNDELQNMHYNDRMPVVVFVEDGMTLDYKIWRVNPEETRLEAPVE